MKKIFTLLTAAIIAVSMAASCEKRKYLQSDPDVLTSRQIEILEENSLPTDMDKLNARQSGGIKAIESAFVYLEEKYPGVEFEYISHTQAGLMNTEYTTFVPVGLDKEDDRNIVTVNYDREGNYSDDYMLVAVREETEKSIEKYLESYFGKDNFKVFVHPVQTDLQYGDVINEENIKGNVQSVVDLFVCDDTCSEDKLNEFAKYYKNYADIYKCRFRTVIINQEDLDKLNYSNQTDIYDGDHIIYRVDIC